mmetsp:Transcript_5187/g.15775  ORF Transcript_5187/g.15775 Transcript_5187/m.15775 type:complete len:97 (-) Transcript_5187:84-374(-)
MLSRVTIASARSEDAEGGGRQFSGDFRAILCLLFAFSLNGRRPRVFRLLRMPADLLPISRRQLSARLPGALSAACLHSAGCVFEAARRVHSEEVPM